MPPNVPDNAGGDDTLATQRLLEDFEEMKDKVGRIHDALLGTLLFPASGALHRLTAMEMHVKTLEGRVVSFEERSKRVDSWVRNALWAIITTMVLTLVGGGLGMVWYFVQKGVEAEASAHLTDRP